MEYGGFEDSRDNNLRNPQIILGWTFKIDIHQLQNIIHSKSISTQNSHISKHPNYPFKLLDKNINCTTKTISTTNAGL